MYFKIFKQVRELETERLNKWLKMLKNWDKYNGGEKVIKISRNLSNLFMCGLY